MPRFVRAMSWMGSFSYSLYLVHLPVLFWLAYRVPAFEGNSAERVVLRFVALVPITVAVAYVFHRLVERHFMTARRPVATVPARA
jgi:peptidoglycan/LPS O-acetylase OafA/YrhL